MAISYRVYYSIRTETSATTSSPSSSCSVLGPSTTGVRGGRAGAPRTILPRVNVVQAKGNCVAAGKKKKSRHGRGILTHGGRSKNKQQRCSAAKAGSWHGHRRPACCQCQGTHATLRPGRYRPPPRRQVAYSYDCVRRRRRYPSCSAPLTRSPGAGRGWGWGARCRWVPTSSSCAIPRRFRWPFGL
jgi:hypothetical protein